MRVLSHILAACVCMQTISVASAKESSSNLAILGLDPVAAEQLTICRDADPISPNAKDGACTRLMDHSFFKDRPTEKSILYLYRSTAQLQLGRFEKAIQDADRAAQDFPDDADTENQRCWARAYAGLELDQALAACLRAIGLGGATPGRLDSLALVHLRKGNWNAAISEYDFAGKWMKDSIYGRILAEYYYRALQKNNPSMQEEILKLRIMPLKAELDVQALASAIKKFEAMGITQSSLEYRAQSE